MQNQSYILSVIDMYVNAALHKFEIVVKALAVIMLCALLLLFSGSCSGGAQNGIKFCLNVLIPSLFPFMAASSFLIKSGLSEQIGKPFAKITKAVFGLNGNFAPIIILSMIGGYPVGARGISALKKYGAASESEVKKAAMFAVCAGPGFIVNFVGVSLYHNETIGMIILISQIISVIILGILINLFDRKNSNNNFFIAKKNTLPFSTALVEAAADSSKGMLGICSFVIIFSAYTAIFGEIINDNLTQNLIFCLLEVCSAVNNISQNSPVELVAFAIGFGGLCVHFQIFSALGDIKINKLIFFIIRIIQGAITALLTHIGLMLFIGETAVFSTSSVENADVFNGSIISGAVLICVAICFLFTLKSYRTN